MKQIRVFKKAVAMTVVCFAAVFAEAVTYTWIGGTDNNWGNSANWDANGIPPVDVNGSVYNTANIITIQNGTYRPTTGVPTVPNNYAAASTVPLFVIQPGASLSVSAYNTNNIDVGAQNTNAVVIGSGGSLTFVMNNPLSSMINLARNAGRQTYTINGGTLTFDAFRLNIGYQSTNFTTINLDGGTVNLTGTRLYGTRTVSANFATAGYSLVNLVNGSTFNASNALFSQLEGTVNLAVDPTLVFDIQDTGSKVLGKYGTGTGVTLTSFATVTNALGVYFISSTLGNASLVATDLGNSQFSVTAVVSKKLSLVIIE